MLWRDGSVAREGETAFTAEQGAALRRAMVPRMERIELASELTMCAVAAGAYRQLMEDTGWGDPGAGEGYSSTAFLRYLNAYLVSVERCNDRWQTDPGGYCRSISLRRCE